MILATKCRVDRAIFTVAVSFGCRSVFKALRVIRIVGFAAGLRQVTVFVFAKKDMSCWADMQIQIPPFSCTVSSPSNSKPSSISANKNIFYLTIFAFVIAHVVSESCLQCCVLSIPIAQISPKTANGAGMLQTPTWLGLGYVLLSSTSSVSR
jgi:hypothetical protein